VRSRPRRDSLDGVGVGVPGVGHVGAALVDLPATAGAEVFVTDVDPGRSEAVAARHGAAALPLDGLAPCLLAGTIGGEEVEQLVATVIAGGANNPLASSDLGARLRARGVLYVPDFVAN
jgi:leucine dehydrogenase